MRLEVNVNARLLDWIERVAIILLYGVLVYRMADGLKHGLTMFNLLPLLSESVVVVFVLTRRATDNLSRNVGDWALAALGTCLPLMVGPGSDQAISAQLGVSLFCAGFALQFFAKLALGRSFGILPANRGLKFSGPYRLIRHPMYAGYLMTHIGFLIVVPSLTNLLIYLAALLAQIYRLLAEERLLSADAMYRDYQTSVRYRLLPGIF